MGRKADEAFKVHRESTPGSFIKVEEDWYEDSVRTFKDKYEQKIEGLKIPPKWVPSVIQGIASKLDNLHDEVAPLVRKYSSLVEKLEEGRKTIFSISKHKKRQLFPNEKPTAFDNEIKKEIAEQGIDDATALMKVKLSYLKSLEDRILHKKQMLYIDRTPFQGKK